MKIQIELLFIFLILFLLLGVSVFITLLFFGAFGGSDPLFLSILGSSIDQYVFISNSFLILFMLASLVYLAYSYVHPSKAQAFVSLFVILFLGYINAFLNNFILTINQIPIFQDLTVSAVIASAQSFMLTNQKIYVLYIIYIISIILNLRTRTSEGERGGYG